MRGPGGKSQGKSRKGGEPPPPTPPQSSFLLPTPPGRKTKGKRGIGEGERGGGLGQAPPSRRGGGGVIYFDWIFVRVGGGGGGSEASPLIYYIVLMYYVQFLQKQNIINLHQNILTKILIIYKEFIRLIIYYWRYR